MSRKRKIIVGVVAGILILGVIGSALSDESEEPPRASTSAASQPLSAPQPEPTVLPALPVTAIGLYQERKDNATRFDLEYKDKRVEITGMVGQVEDGDVRLVVDEEAYRLLDTVFLEYVALQDLPREVQAGAEKGQPFTATCVVGNYVLGAIYLEDCTTP